MTDNLSVTQGTGTTIAADDIGGVLHQRVKLSQGADGSATDVSSAAPLNVTLANTGANATAVKVDGSAVTQPISAASLPLPSLAATSTKQSDGSQKTQIVDGSGNVIGATSNALDVNIKSGASSGTEYTEGDTDASFTGTIMLAETTGNTATPLQVDGSGHLQVDLAASSTSVTVSDGGGSLTVDNNGTFAVQASLSAGTNNIGDVDVLTLPALPAGTNNIGDVDVLTVNGVAPAFGTGVRGATVQRVTIATDDVIGITANSSVNVAQMNGVATSMGNGASGTGVQRVTVANDSTGILAGVTTVTTLTNQSQMGGQAIAMGTGTRSAGTQRVTIATDDLVPVSMATNTPVGNVAHDSADSGAPIKFGGRARTTEIAAVASDDRTDAIFDKVGKQVTLPYALPENFVSGAITSAMTGTTSTSLIAAPAGSLRNYITTIIVTNSHATVGTDVIIQDGSGGTTLMTIPAAAVYGGAVINLPVPLRQPTTATAIYCANVTTGASTKVSAVGYTGL